mgnify:CR=1 FL=1
MTITITITGIIVASIVFIGAVYLLTRIVKKSTCKHDYSPPQVRVGKFNHYRCKKCDHSVYQDYNINLKKETKPKQEN